MERVLYMFAVIYVNVQLDLPVEIVKRVSFNLKKIYQRKAFILDLIVQPSIDLCNRTTCIHGDCLKNGTCLCHKFWSGEKCNRSKF